MPEAGPGPRLRPGAGRRCRPEGWCRPAEHPSRLSPPRESRRAPALPVRPGGRRRHPGHASGARHRRVGPGGAPGGTRSGGPAAAVWSRPVGE
ncbi:MAG: hypothetical protein DSY73_07240 [Actinobacteria bacterium]|nr:MAG: hypothetical protein DSY73_07240 [Actinomycetota bacterium]